jgi:hypothetical protein
MIIGESYIFPIETIKYDLSSWSLVNHVANWPGL